MYRLTTIAQLLTGRKRTTTHCCQTYTLRQALFVGRQQKKKSCHLHFPPGGLATMTASSKSVRPRASFSVRPRFSAKARMTLKQLYKEEIHHGGHILTSLSLATVIQASQLEHRMSAHMRFFQFCACACRTRKKKVHTNRLRSSERLWLKGI